MRCAFCITGEENEPREECQSLDLAALSRELRSLGPAVRSVTISGGEPFVHLDWALSIASLVPASLQLVWKTNLYTTPEALALVEATRNNTNGTITATVEGPPADEIQADGKVSFTLKAAVTGPDWESTCTKDGATQVKTVTAVEMGTADTSLCFKKVNGFAIKAHGVCDGEAYAVGKLGLPWIHFEIDAGGTGVTLEDDGHGNATLVAPANPVCGDVKVMAFMLEEENPEFVLPGTGDLESAEITIQVRKIQSLVRTPLRPTDEPPGHAASAAEV